MTVDINDGVLQLRSGGYARLERARGARLTGLHGSAWITLDGETRDIVLAPGEVFELDSDAAVLVTAILGDARIGVQVPDHGVQRRRWKLPLPFAARLAGALSSSRRTLASAS